MNAESKTGARPLVYYGWLVVAVCVLSKVAANSLTINTFSFFLLPWSHEMGLPISTLLLVMSASGLVTALIAPLTGFLSDKYPARALLGIGQAGLALVFCGIGVATRPWQIFALLIVPFPFAMSLTTVVVSNALISRWFVRRLGLALGLSSLGLGVGSAILPPIVAALLPAVGWRVIWQAAGAIIALTLLPLTLLTVRDRPTAREGLHYVETTAEANAPRAPDTEKVAADNRLRLGTVLKSRNFWLLIAAYLPMLLLWGISKQIIAPLVASRGMSGQVAGMVLSVLGFAQIAATIGAGALCDRLGPRLPLALLGVAAAIGGTLIAFGQGVPLLVAGMALVACGGSFWPVVTSALAAEFGANRVGRAFGMATLFQPIGMIAPFSVAKAQEITGSYAPGLTAMVVLSLLGAFASLFLRFGVDPARQRADRTDPALAA